MKSIIISVFVLFLSISLKAQNHGLVQWKTFKEVQELQKKDPKPILIDFYTSWCGWCKKMIATTYSDPQVANFINTNFYAIQFDAETMDSIVFLGKTYTNAAAPGARRSTHSLTRELLGGRISYPTTLFMDEKYGNRLIVPGYLESNKLAPFLVYYNEHLYRNVSIEPFREYFTKTFEEPSKGYKEIEWNTFNEAAKKNTSEEKRKLMLFFDNPENIASKIMDSVTFVNPFITDYLNTNYYPVRFNVFSTDTIQIGEQNLVKLPNQKYHQLVYAILKENPKFPCVVFFDENSNMITPVPEFMTPEFAEVVLTFFKEDKFKTMQFNEFRDSFVSKIK